MGILDRLRSRRPSQDQFARMLLKRIVASGDTRPVQYDKDGFRLVKSTENVMFLGNLYQEYLRAEPSDREQVIRAFLTTWHTSELPVPDDFTDVKADLLPALRSRSYLEVDLLLSIDQPRGKQPPPYEIVGDHLAATLVYDLPNSMMTVNDEALDKWGVTFYEAMEVARKNLDEKPTQVAQIGSLYALANGDAYDATRMLSTEFIRRLDIDGDVIAMIPNRDRLYLCGADDDEAQKAMLHFVGDDVQHERFISGMPFCLTDQWRPWRPPEDNPHATQFHQLWIQTLAESYSSQKELMDKQHEAEGIDIFVASYSGAENKTTGQLASYCVWVEGVDSLLPETDQVYFTRPDTQGELAVVAQADWELVLRLAGELMEEQDFYPQRWRVREFPSDTVLQALGGELGQP